MKPQQFMRRGTRPARRAIIGVLLEIRYFFGGEFPASYSRISRLIVGYLTDDLRTAEWQALEDWVNASDDHLVMMADFGSIGWHAQQARSFEEPDKLFSWHLIQEKVARLPGTPPLPDLQEREWTVRQRVSFFFRLVKRRFL